MLLLEKYHMGKGTFHNSSSVEMELTFQGDNPSMETINNSLSIKFK